MYIVQRCVCVHHFDSDNIPYLTNRRDKTLLQASEMWQFWTTFHDNQLGSTVLASFLSYIEQCILLKN